MENAQNLRVERQRIFHRNRIQRQYSVITGENYREREALIWCTCYTRILTVREAQNCDKNYIFFFAFDYFEW